MRRAVDFHDEHFFAADEIGEIRPDRFLPHEFEAVKTAGAQPKPKLALGLRLRSTQVSRAIRLERA